MRSQHILLFLLILTTTFSIAKELPQNGLLLDLDAAIGLSLGNNENIDAWENQVASAKPRLFIKRDAGRKEPNSGCPTLRKAVPELGDKPSVVFRQQELVCMDEDTFDPLTTGQGHTWLAILAVHPQRVGLKDVNSFFGNLRNGEKYEGIWGCFNDDNTLWYGTRNGITFGRFDENNPQLLGPVLPTGTFHLVGGRMAAGTGSVTLELYHNSAKPVAAGKAPVNPAANPSRMTIGQERDAIEHPGLESFDGEIARFLIWQRPLSDAELETSVKLLQSAYFKE